MRKSRQPSVEELKTRLEAEREAGEIYRSLTDRINREQQTRLRNRNAALQKENAALKNPRSAVIGTSVTPNLRPVKSTEVVIRERPRRPRFK